MIVPPLGYIEVNAACRSVAHIWPQGRVGSAGGNLMADYHLYFLQGNKLVGADHIQAESDLEAVRIARRRGTGDAVEVWNARRRIRVVAPAETGSGIGRAAPSARGG
jgi:hypothetical protein